MITLNDRMWITTRCYCTGVELAALALSAAGTGTSIYAQGQANKRSEDAAQAELVRQKGFQKGATNAFQQSLAQGTPEVAQKQIDEGALKAQQQYAALAQIPLSVAPTEKTNDEVVQQGAQSGQLAQQALSRAKLQGYSTWDLDQWIKNLRAMQQQNMYSSFARGSEQVLPLELQQAQRSMDRTKALGQGLSMAGSLAGLYGAMAAPSLGQTAGMYRGIQSPANNPGYFNTAGWNAQPNGQFNWSPLGNY